MKNMKAKLNRMMLVFCSVFFALCFSCKDASDDEASVTNENEASTSYENVVVLQDADYTSKNQLEWYNFFENTKALSIRNDQKYYSAILNASNGVFNRYAKELIQDTGENHVVRATLAKEYVCFDHPQVRLMQYEFEYAEDGTYKVNVKNEDEYRRKVSEIDETIDEIVTEVNQETSLISKYRLINDWMVQQIDYDHDYAEIVTKNEIWTDEEKKYYYNSNANNIYGAIVEKYAVCSGISEAYKYICSKCNLQCMVVYGDAGEGHAWNVVPIYGNYFLVDCTWELKSNIEYGTYYVQDEKSKMLTIKSFDEHNYFLLNDMSVSDRTIDNELLDSFFKKDKLQWKYEDNKAKANNGLEITLPEDYEFCNSFDSYNVYGMNSEGYRKLFDGEEFDEIEFKTNGQIEHVIAMNDYKNRQVESVNDFIGKEYLYADDIEPCCILVVRYEGELYSIKLYQTGM